MDLRQVAAAFRAHRFATTLGVGAAICLAFLAYVRVDPFGDPTFQYRRSAVWASRITIQLTQQGFPEGQIGEISQESSGLVGLTPLYARLATSDEVKRRMHRTGPVYGGIKVVPLVDQNRSALPVISLTGFALTQAAAAKRVTQQAAAFTAYIAGQQRANSVKPRNRVVLRKLSGPSRPFVVVPRKITLPVVVFLSMLVVTTAFVLVLENLRRTALRKTESDEELRLRESEGLRPVPGADDVIPVAQTEPVATPAVGGRRWSRAPRHTLRAGQQPGQPETEGDGSQLPQPADQSGQAKSGSARRVS